MPLNVTDGETFLSPCPSVTTTYKNEPVKFVLSLDL